MASAPPQIPTSLDEFKTRVDIFASITTTLGLVIGGGIGLYQYSEKNQAERIKEALSYREKLAEPVIRKYREELNMAFVSRHAEFEAAAGGKDDSYSRWVLDLIDKNKLAASIHGVGEVYEQLAICVSASLCDRATSVRFFSEEVRAFHNSLYPYIQERRRETNDPSLFGHLAEFIATRPKRVGQFAKVDGGAKQPQPK